MKKNNFMLPNKPQQGFALVITLMLLFVITLVGITSFRLNINNEVMSGNAYFSAQAKEAAELTLKIAENSILNANPSFDQVVFFNSGRRDNDFTRNNDGDQCLGGICTPMRRSLNYNPDDIDYERWVDKDSPKSLQVWRNNRQSIAVRDAITTQLGLTQSPRYIIEFIGYTPDTNLSNGKLRHSKCDDNRDGTAAGDATVDWDQWPFCTRDHKMYRITAFAQVNTARTMLQSVFITP